MARNGSGTYSKVNTFSSGATITASGHNDNWNDLVTEMTNSVAADGQTTMTGPLKAANGTAAAPSYTFGSDSNTGMWHIGSDNIGIGVNGAAVLDISTAGVVLTPALATASIADAAVTNAKLASGAIAALQLANSAIAQSVGMINGKITASVGSSALTVALKNLAGNDPSSTDPVLISFRNATSATGDYAVLSITAAASVVISSGSTLGTSDGVPFRLWLVGFNDTGTFRLGLINCSTSTNIYPLSDAKLASATNEGGAGAADSAGVFYAGATVTSKALRILGYLDFSSGEATAGTWATAPDKIQLFGSGVPRPGSLVQSVYNITAGTTTNNTTTYAASPLSQAVSLSSAINLAKVTASIAMSPDAASHTMSAQVQRDSTQVSQPQTCGTGSTTGGWPAGMTFVVLDKPQTTSSVTYAVYFKNSGAGTNSTAGGGQIIVEEIMG